MDIQEFRSTIGDELPPAGTSLSLQALWHQAKGNWDRAHEMAQKDKSKDGDWIHAHLHRVEGDDGNAGYWYRRADKPFSTLTLEEEWEEITLELLARSR